MANSWSSRSRRGARPFLISTVLLTLLTLYAVFLPRPRFGADARDASNADDADISALRARSKFEPECREVAQAADQCAFVRAYCGDDEAGLIHYLSFYYCSLASAKPVAFVVLVLWLGLLFSTIGIAASDFFSVNLSTIASVLGLSESLAGVTFLAFGNGSPDVFSTFAAMGSNSGSMAVGELIGAASFITAVVAGSMALVREFKVSRKTFMRDILFFLVAVGFSMVFLADGRLHMWECLCMIGFYLFYVIVVVGWHWWTTRRRSRRLRDVASRLHCNLSPGRGASDELEPYRDEPDDDDEAAPMGPRTPGMRNPVDMAALERPPRIAVEGVELQSPLSPEEEEEEDELGLQVAAEMTSSMRVMRPRWGRSNTTITPIRPSLVGALEFRSVLASLQKERNMQLANLPERANSLNPTLAVQNWEEAVTSSSIPPLQRDRALSHGNLPLHLANDTLPQPGDGLPHGHLHNSPAFIGESTITGPHPKSPKAAGLQLQIPASSAASSASASPSLSPFPAYFDSVTEFPSSGSGSGTRSYPPAFALPSPASIPHSMPGIDSLNEGPKPLTWWPYNTLPAPHVVFQALFPTLQGWKEKSWWDKLLSLISVPSIVLLVITLPVVESEKEGGENEDDDDMVMADPVTPGSPGHVAPPVSIECNGHIAPDTEWQEYRRRRRSRSTANTSPARSIIGSPGTLEAGLSTSSPARPPISPILHSLPALRVSTPDATDIVSSPMPVEAPEADTGWNRWLVIVQLFTGPLFVVLILWANMHEDMAQPGRTLVKMVLYSLLVSLCLLLVLLLTTSVAERPRYHYVLCFLGFVISVAWISTVAGEVVGVLKAFGVILGISEAILGLTIFAVGNSLGDLVADVTVARLGYPVMALAACFGGPLLNILLGVGLGGAWMIVNTANDRHRRHPDKPRAFHPYKLQVGGTLMISAITVLITLVVLLVVVPANRWVMSRRIGWGLIAIWTVGTIVNLVFELTGTWSDVS